MFRTILFVLSLTFVLAAQASAQNGLPVPPADGTCSADAAAKTDGINWEPNLQVAMAKSKKLDRPIFMVFLCRFLGNCDSPHA